VKRSSRNACRVSAPPLFLTEIDLTAGCLEVIRHGCGVCRSECRRSAAERRGLNVECSAKPTWMAMSPIRRRRRPVVQQRGRRA